MLVDAEYAISLDDFSGLPCHVVNLYRNFLNLVTPIGVQASGGPEYSGAVFGRDALRVGLDLAPWFPQFIEQILVSLAWLQGNRTDDMSEEEPGKIPHEYRPSKVGQRTLNFEQSRTLQKLRRIWKDEEDVVYYGSADATPQFVRLISEAVSFHGDNVLAIEFIHKSGEIRTLRDSLLSAALWIEDNIARSDLTLLEFQRRNPNGHRYQVLRDGVTSYLHADTGELVNPDQPIASLEVQALAIDALRIAARLLGDCNPHLADRWRQLAAAVRDRTFEWFWLSDARFFAMAIDRDSNGNPRQVRTRSSVSAELLETSIFDGLPQPERISYVCAIVNEMCGPEFQTPAGIRCLARSHHGLLPYWDYQGALSTWVTITDSFARGLRRQGLSATAIDQENRYLNALNLAGDFVEFLFVDAEGRVDYDPYQRHGSNPAATIIPSKETPNQNQAWTISAAFRAVLSRTVPDAMQTTETPQATLPCLDPDAMTAPVPLLRTKQEIQKAYPTEYAFRIDELAGRSLLREHWRDKGVRLYHHGDPANAR